jgi:hypothetical protein
LKTSNIEANEDFNQILAEVAGYLTSDEATAVNFMKYLVMSKTASLDVQLLRERLYKANEITMCNRV